MMNILKILKTDFRTLHTSNCEWLTIVLGTASNGAIGSDASSADEDRQERARQDTAVRERAETWYLVPFKDLVTNRMR